MSEELKPCPFCGHSAHLHQGATTYVKCYSCGCMTTTYAGSYESNANKAIAAWNTRTEWMCHIEHWGGGVFYLDCGHEAYGYTKPNYCHVCGAKVSLKGDYDE